MAETSQGKLRTNLEAVAKSKHLALLTQDRNFSETELRAAACNQMNAPLKQLRSKKLPQCAWSIRRDVSQGLRMQETFHCGCYVALVARGQVLQTAGAWRFIFFTEVWHVESSLQISVKAFLTDVYNRAKDFTFVQPLYL